MSNQIQVIVVDKETGHKFIAFCCNNQSTATIDCFQKELTKKIHELLSKKAGKLMVKYAINRSLFYPEPLNPKPFEERTRKTILYI